MVLEPADTAVMAGRAGTEVPAKRAPTRAVSPPRMLETMLMAYIRSVPDDPRLVPIAICREADGPSWPYRPGVAISSVPAALWGHCHLQDKENTRESRTRHGKHSDRLPDSISTADRCSTRAMDDQRGQQARATDATGAT